MNTITVSSYYKPCPKRAHFDALAGNQRGAAYGKALSAAFDSLKKEIPYEEIIDELKNNLAVSHDTSWFPFSWMKAQVVEDDVAKFTRFLNWIGTPKILDANVPVHVTINDTVLCDSVSLILCFGDRKVALIVNQGKNKFSFASKSIHTKADHNLRALVAKYALEDSYPGISVTNVYLTAEQDTTGHLAPNYVIDKTRSLAYYKP